MTANQILNRYTQESLKAELNSISNSFREIDAGKRNFAVSGFRKRVCVDCGAHVVSGAPRCKSCSIRYVTKHRRDKK